MGGDDESKDGSKAGVQISVEVPEKFLSLVEFKDWVSELPSEEECKASLGVWKKDACRGPKKQKRVKCKRVKAAEVCEALGCKSKKGRCKAQPRCLSGEC